jgi:GT2 family glycosyltransferase
MKKITVCLTSCNRFDLLSKTLDSFFEVNSYPIEKIIITEDSTNIDMKNNILNKYGDKVELIFNVVNLGIYRSIDNMYNLVDTEYIFHCEDDWSFSYNINFMQESIDILEERKDIHRVCIRNDLQPDYIEPNHQFTSTYVEFNLLKNPHCGIWCGFSNNPGLRRKSDYTQMFPNGLSEFILPNQAALYTEINCNNHAARLGYRAALLKDRVCTHIGWGRSTI